jgi:hypothetical protein
MFCIIIRRRWVEITDETLTLMIEVFLVVLNPYSQFQG